MSTSGIVKRSHSSQEQRSTSPSADPDRRRLSSPRRTPRRDHRGDNALGVLEADVHDQRIILAGEPLRFRLGRESPAELRGTASGRVGDEPDRATRPPGRPRRRSRSMKRTLSCRPASQAPTRGSFVRGARKSTHSPRLVTRIPFFSAANFSSTQRVNMSCCLPWLGSASCDRQS